MLPPEDDIIAAAQFMLEQANKGRISEQDSENVAWICEEFLNLQKPIRNPHLPLTWRIIYGQCWDEEDLHRLLKPIAHNLLLAKDKNDDLKGFGYFVGTYASIKHALKNRPGWSIVTRTEPCDLHLPETP